MPRWTLLGLVLGLALFAIAAPPVLAASSDIRVLKVLQTPDSNVHSGDIIQYRITIGNLGPDPVPSMTLVDPLPPDTTFVSLTGTIGSFFTPPVGQHGVVTILIPGPHAAGQATSYTLRVRVNDCVQGSSQISNVATGSSPNPDPTPLNQSGATAATAVNPGCQLPPTGGTSNLKVSVVDGGAVGQVPCKGRRLFSDDTLERLFDLFEGTLDADRVAAESCIPQNSSNDNTDDIVGGILMQFSADEIQDFEVIRNLPPALANPLTLDIISRTGPNPPSLLGIQTTVQGDSPNVPQLNLPSCDMDTPASHFVAATAMQTDTRIAVQGMYCFTSSVFPADPLSNLLTLCRQGDCAGIVKNTHIVIAENEDPSPKDVLLVLTAEGPIVKNVKQFAIPYEGMNDVLIGAPAMVTGAPAMVAGATVPTTATASASGKSLSLSLTGPGGKSKVGFVVQTYTALTIPGRARLLTATVSGSGTEVSPGNNTATAVMSIAVGSASGSPPAKPVPPQVFQNPGAIGIVSQRPPRTPTPTPVTIR